MRQNDDHYQRYADLLGEPVTQDLRAFVDALNEEFATEFGPVSALPTPVFDSTVPEEAIMLFDTANHPVNSPIIAPEVLSRALRRQRRWSLALVAAVAVIAILAGTFITVIRAQPANGVAPLGTKPVGARVTCFALSTYDPLAHGPISSCDKITTITQAAVGADVSLTYCFTIDTPFPSSVRDQILVPGGHDVLGGMESIPFVQQTPFCNSSSIKVEKAGQYVILLYWANQIFSDPTSDSVQGSRLWQLQIITSFDVK